MDDAADADGRAAGSDPRPARGCAGESTTRDWSSPATARRPIPSRWNRDYFAFLPFQLSARRFAVPYYVVTLNAAKAWRPELGPLDPARYDMPNRNTSHGGQLRRSGSAVSSAYDPLRGVAVPVKVLAATATSLTVRLTAADYPRVLLVDEAAPGPLILHPRVAPGGRARRLVGSQTNLPADHVRVTYGR